VSCFYLFSVVSSENKFDNFFGLGPPIVGRRERVESRKHFYDKNLRNENKKVKINCKSFSASKDAQRRDSFCVYLTHSDPHTQHR
jgi:hypothetical protein